MKAHTLLHVNIQKRNKRELWERRCKKKIYIYMNTAIFYYDLARTQLNILLTVLVTLQYHIIIDS